MKPLHLGLIGPGGIARAAHIPCIDMDPNLKLVALAASREETARNAAERYRAQAYGDYRELLKRADIEAVLVATPPNLHEQIAKEAMVAGKHVLLETPVTSDPAAARRLGELARAKKLVAQAAFPFRSSPQIAILKERADAVKAPKLWSFEYFPFLLHTFDLALHCCGKLEKVVSSTNDKSGITATLRFINGDTAVIVGRNIANCSIDIERISVSGGDFYGAIEGRSRVRMTSGMKYVPFDAWSVSTSGGESFEPTPWAAHFNECTGYAPQLRAFVRSVREGMRPPATMEDAAESLELALSVRVEP